MTIQDWAAIAEVVSALAVVISLVYLAIQIRQNTRQLDENTNAVKAAAVHASLSFAIQNRAAQFTSENTADVYRRGLQNPESLSELEQLRFRLMCANVFDAALNMYSQTKATGFSIETWGAQANIVRRLLTTPGCTWFWNAYGSEFPSAFQEEISRLRQTA